MARIFNAVRAENTPPRHARGDIKQALRKEFSCQGRGDVATKSPTADFRRGALICSVLFIKRGIDKVDVLLTKAVLCQTQTLAEVSNLSKSHRTLANAGFRGFFCVGKIGETSPHLKNLDVTEVLSGNSI